MLVVEDDPQKYVPSSPSTVSPTQRYRPEKRSAPPTFLDSQAVQRDHTRSPSKKCSRNTLGRVNRQRHTASRRTDQRPGSYHRRQHVKNRSPGRNREQRACDTRDRDARHRDTRGGDSRDRDARQGDMRHEDSRDRDARHRDTRGGDSRDRDARHRDTRREDSRDRDARHRDTRGGDSRDRDARHTRGGDSRDRDARHTRGGDSRDRDARHRDTRGGDTSRRRKNDRDETTSPAVGDALPVTKPSGRYLVSRRDDFWRDPTLSEASSRGRRAQDERDTAGHSSHPASTDSPKTLSSPPNRGNEPLPLRNSEHRRHAEPKFAEDRFDDLGLPSGSPRAARALSDRSGTAKGSNASPREARSNACRDRRFERQRRHVFSKKRRPRLPRRRALWRGVVRSRGGHPLVPRGETNEVETQESTADELQRRKEALGQNSLLEKKKDLDGEKTACRAGPTKHVDSPFGDIYEETKAREYAIAAHTKDIQWWRMPVTVGQTVVALLAISSMILSFFAKETWLAVFVFVSTFSALLPPIVGIHYEIEWLTNSALPLVVSVAVLFLLFVADVWAGRDRPQSPQFLLLVFSTVTGICAFICLALVAAALYHIGQTLAARKEILFLNEILKHPHALRPTVQSVPTPQPEDFDFSVQIDP